MSDGAAEHSGVFPDPYNVKLLFDKSVRFRLIEDYGLNCYNETDAGLLLELDYTNRDYIKAWVLGFGDAVTVLEPVAFREEIKQTAKSVLKEYN